MFKKKMKTKNIFFVLSLKKIMAQQDDMVIE